LLKEWGLMEQPCLDLSAYVLRHRDTYIAALQRVSLRGDWTGWIQFVLEGVEAQANDAFRRSEMLLEIRQRYLRRLTTEINAKAVEPVVDELFMTQRLTAKRLRTLLEVSPATAQRMIERLESTGIIKERTGRTRNRVFVAPEVIGILDTTS
jgi:Fic family protein